jgi:aryl-alcohol dehydrogenase-like predicted oxidoreductase
MQSSPHHLLSRRAVLGAAGAAAIASFGGGLALASQDAAAELNLRTIPSSGVKIPSVGLGTSRQFDADLSDTAVAEELKQCLQAFLDAGGTVVDSSPMYGKAEEVVGKLSSEMGNNDKLWIATKVWTRDEKDAAAQMKRSMQLLGREGQHIELMQVHNLVDVDENLKILQQWKEEGTFRHIGITSSQRNVIPELEAYANGKGGIKLDFIQLPYNIEMREAAERLLPACKDNGVATMINVPFGSGRIFRQVRDRPLPEHAQRYAGSWAQALLKFILANEAVTVAIPGTSDPKHASDNCQAMRGPLPTEDEIKRLIQEVSA